MGAPGRRLAGQDYSSRYMDDTADVGIDLATPVVEAIGAESKSRFTGKIRKVTVEVK